MHCYQAFLCYWDGYHLKKYNELIQLRWYRPTPPAHGLTLFVSANVKSELCSVADIRGVGKPSLENLWSLEVI